MGIKEKLPLLNSNSRIVRLFGYVVYVLLAFTVLGALLPSTDVDDSTTTKAISSAAEDKTPTAKEPVKEAAPVKSQKPKDFSEEDRVTVSKVYTAVDGKIGDDIKVSVNDLDGGKNIIVTSLPKTFWNEKSTVKQTAWDSVDVFKILFSNPTVKRVVVIQQADFTDSYGNKKTENALMIEMRRNTADKINWDNFGDIVLSDYNNLFRVADSYTIHGAIRKAL